MSSSESQSSISSYAAPSAREMAQRQDRTDALRPLYVQRKLYSKSKRFLALRMWGMGVIAIAAPVIAFVWPGTAVIVGAIAGGWLALGRILFIKMEDHYTRQAAAVQEQFDTYVFKMPEIAVRPDAPSLETIALISGPDTELRQRSTNENLLAWYPIDAHDSGTTAVAVCQRANVSYSKSLLKVTSLLWAGVILGWFAILICISIYLGLTLAAFLLAVFLPLATPLVELYEYWKRIRTAAIERNALSQEIENKLKSNDVTGEELIIWQTRMYDMRISMPQVPDLLYMWQRKANEKAMHTAAQQLSDRKRHL